MTDMTVGHNVIEIVNIIVIRLTPPRGEGQAPSAANASYRSAAGADSAPPREGVVYKSTSGQKDFQLI